MSNRGQPGAREGAGGAFYRADGPAAAPVLVLLGSLGTTADVWDSQLQALRPWLRTLRVEHPGHGGSARLPGKGSVEALGKRVLGLLDELQVERASVAGLSLGGLVGLWLAANHPERVDRLVLACTTARFENSATYAERAVAVRASGTAPLVPGALSRWFTDGFSRANPDVPARYGAMLAAIDPEGYAYCCEAVASADLRGEVAGIEAPTLVVGGARDPVVTPAQAGALASSLKDAMLCVLPGAAHLANVEQTGYFNDALMAHLVGSASRRGLEVRKDVLGAAHVQNSFSRASELSSDFQELLGKWPWGEIWARPGLDRLTRRLLAIAMLVALNRPEELEMHIRAGLRDGITVDVLKEVLLQTAIYAGAPAANAAFAIADRVVLEGQDPAI
ncbi:MAG TPA: alpha/beta fold hydrolase [Acidimicrobiales bacterium]|nr:alpha/beta fold hydrolase [Acidimicrobiales bacterium]